jgi:hypothetical protein
MSGFAPPASRNDRKSAALFDIAGYASGFEDAMHRR